MEKLQGPINPYLLEEDLEVGNGDLGMSYEQFLSYNKYEDPYIEEANDPHYTLEDKMPFLQMLQGTEPRQPPLMQDSSFQLLLRLQHQKMMTMKPWELTITNNNDTIMELHSPSVKSETFCRDYHQIPQNLSPKCSNQQNQRAQIRSKKTQLTNKSNPNIPLIPRERRKRKRSTKPAKNKEEVESQRMTHIAVERNRRRQMNDHLNALRSLMPSSYIQRGDQASIVGGAIDFAKELEQLLQSLQAQKRMRQSEDQNGNVSATSSNTSSSSNNFLSNLLMTSSSSPTSSCSLQFINPPNSHEKENGNNEEYNNSSENRSNLGDIEVVVIQNHVNLKIQCHRRPGQLLKAIVAFEDLRLAVLHLNITSSFHNLVHYSFNLKIEEDCKLGSADEVARAVYQIFSLINIS